MIGRTELALKYCPRDTAETAWRKLKYWIAYNPKLARALARSGYDGRCRSFTPRQVELIERYLGEP